MLTLSEIGFKPKCFPRKWYERIGLSLVLGLEAALGLNLGPEAALGLYLGPEAALGLDLGLEAPLGLEQSILKNAYSGHAS